MATSSPPNPSGSLPPIAGDPPGWFPLVVSTSGLLRRLNLVLNVGILKIFFLIVCFVLFIVLLYVCMVLLFVFVVVMSVLCELFLSGELFWCLYVRSCSIV